MLILERFFDKVTEDNARDHSKLLEQRTGYDA